jgi:HPt (histidine-containing phosphotransfer) domain-containing protein
MSVCIDHGRIISRIRDWRAAGFRGLRPTFPEPKVRESRKVPVCFREIPVPADPDGQANQGASNPMQDTNRGTGGEPEVTFDREKFLSKFDGDFEVATEIANIFIEDSARMMGQIRMAAGAGDWKKLKEEAHSLKGTVGNMSAVRGYQLALDLEGVALRGDAAAAVGKIAEIEGEMGALLAALKDFIAEGQPATGA